MSFGYDSLWRRGGRWGVCFASGRRRWRAQRESLIRREKGMS